MQSLVTFKCSKCGSVETVESVNETYFGSDYDFCGACGEGRDADNDVVSVVGPLAALVAEPKQQIEEPCKCGASPWTIKIEGVKYCAQCAPRAWNWVGEPPECECDNTHEQNDTVCMWCWNRGRRHYNDAEVVVLV